MKIKKYLPLIGFLLLSLVFSVCWMFCCAKEYHGIYHTGKTVTSASIFDWKAKNGNVEITDMYMEDEYLHYIIRPLHEGYDTVEITAEQGEFSYMSVDETWCGPFDTVFICGYVFDFNGANVVKVVVILDIIVIAGYMLGLFLYLRKKAAFGYTMVSAGGISLFTIFYVIHFIMSLFGLSLVGGSFDNYFSMFLHDFAAFGSVFPRLTMPFMLVFSVLMMWSNLALIRHEGFRITNLLGFFIGFLWLGGLVTMFWFDENSSGSSFHGTVYDAIVNSIGMIVSYFVCMLISTIVCAAMASRTKPPFDRTHIIILGCAIRNDGSLTPLLRGRADRAVNFEKEQFQATGKHAKFVPSGGQGSDEVISESEAIRRYLIENNIPPEQILTEDQSVNTYQNLLFSKKVIEADSENEYKPAISTTNYHVFRSYVLAEKVGLKNARGLSAKTKWYFFPNAFLRELVGLTVEKKVKHIVILLLMTLATVLASVYLSGI